MKIEDKSALTELLKRYSDNLFQRYYITNPPQIYKSDNVEMGYSKSEKTNSQSIHFGFKTTQPTARDIEMLIKVFVETEINKFD